MEKQIPFGTQEPDKKQMVFCAIYAFDQPWLYYHNAPADKRRKVIPLILMLMRWDGLIGFPGGNVEEGETLKEALKRELDEEINFQLQDEPLVPLASFSLPDRNIHAFSLEVANNAMREIIQDAANAEHFLSENQGCFAAQVASFDRGLGIEQFLKHNFKGTALDELVLLIPDLLNRAAEVNDTEEEITISEEDR